MKLHENLLSSDINTGEVIVNYIVHSCVAIRFEDKLFLFDYASPLAGGTYNQNLDFLGLCSLDSLKHLQVFIFSSHIHSDHYSPNIFDLAPQSNIHFFTSYDIPLPDYLSKIEYAEELTKDNSRTHDVSICEPLKWCEADGIKVYSAASSDEGVAFFIEAPLKTGKNLTIYYSGDNAFWDWKKCRIAEGYFKEFLQPFIDLNQSIDVAFSVADPRCNETHYGGIFDISTFLDIGLLVPIHNFGDFSHNSEMAKRVKEKHPNQKYFEVTGPDQVMTYKLTNGE